MGFAATPGPGAAPPSTSPTPSNVITPAAGTVDPTTQILMSANFDPSKGPVSKFDGSGNLIGPDGNVVLTSAQIHAGTVPDDVLNQIANNPLVKAAVTASTAPLVGGATAIGDTINGNLGQIPGDITYGATGGIAGNASGPASGLVNPKTISDTVTGIGDAASGVGGDISKGAQDVGGAIVTGVKDLGSALGGLGGSTDITTGDADAETARANALADALGGQAGSAGAQADVDRGLGTQTRQQQQDSIAGLTAAANGTAPSAAELQLKQQSGIDAARQYGLAAALQGNNPGAALRQASLGAAQIAGTTNQNAAINRANEQATARGQLASTLANVRQGDQGAVNTDVGQQQNLTGAQVTSQGQGVTSTGQKLTAETEKAKADAVKQGALIGAGATGAAALLSDKRAKKDIVKTDLADALAKGVHGVSFKYIPEAEEDEEPHFGILADALEKVIPGTVSKGARGYKEVNTGHLTMANTAVISELARRLQDLEKGARK